MSFLVLLDRSPNSESPSRIKHARAELEKHAREWDVAYEATHLLVMSKRRPAVDRSSYILPDGRGLILGMIFTRSLYAPAKPISESEAQRIVDSQGRYIVDNFWGGYVAVLYDQKMSRTVILRDPMGEVPCFRTRVGEVEIFFSDVADLMSLFTTRVPIHWSYVAVHLIADEQLGRMTGLEGVEDVIGGEAVSITNGVECRISHWHPTAICVHDPIESSEGTREELRETVRSTIWAWASRYRRIGLRLSGGLDSSIVAGCLAQCPGHPDVSCLNFYFGAGDAEEPIHIPGASKSTLRRVRRMAGHGDEREFARMTAALWNFSLIEKERKVADFNLRRLLDAPLCPRPSRYIQSIDTDDAETALVRQTGAEAIFSGLAGDTVFYTTSRPVAAVDYAYRHPLGPRLMAEIASSSRISGESVWAVFAKAFRYGMLKRPMPPSYDPFRSAHFLPDEVIRSVSLSFAEHPWRHNGRALPPGKLQQVEGLSEGGMYYPYIFHREALAPSINPLAAQPIVELSLRICTDVLLLGGVSRGLAREAFEGILPPTVRRRTIKGLPSTFFLQVVRNNITFIREMLLEGVLRQRGLLDVIKVSQFLTPDQQFSRLTWSQVLVYLACEGWLRQWEVAGRASRPRIALR